MKKLALIVLISLVLTSCGSKNGKSISLFNDVSFEMTGNERVTGIIPLINDKYQSYFKNAPYQVPLFKHVQSSQYNIYIGLPYKTTLSDLINNVDSLSLLKTDSVSYLYSQRDSNNLILSEYVVKCDENLILVLAETNQRAIADSLFNYTKLSSRINTPQK